MRLVGSSRIDDYNVQVSVLIMKKPLMIFACVVLGIIVMTMVWPRRRIHSRVSKCVLNLEQLQEDKRAWANEHHKTKGDIITWEDMAEDEQARTGGASLTHRSSWTNIWPICPAGGTYYLGRVGEPPR